MVRHYSGANRPMISCVGYVYMRPRNPYPAVTFEHLCLKLLDARARDKSKNPITSTLIHFSSFILQSTHFDIAKRLTFCSLSAPSLLLQTQADHVHRKIPACRSQSKSPSASFNLQFLFFAVLSLSQCCRCFILRAFSPWP